MWEESVLNSHAPSLFLSFSLLSSLSFFPISISLSVCACVCARTAFFVRKNRKEKRKQGENRRPHGLNGLAVVLVVLEQGIVVLMEDEAGQLGELGENVASAGGVLASLQTSSEHAVGHQQGDVVGAHKVLRHAHNGGGQAVLAVVVRTVLGHVARQLRHLQCFSVFFWQGEGSAEGREGERCVGGDDRK